MKKSLFVFSLLFFASCGIASAHSTVSPSQTGTSKYETFTLSVPSEKDMPTIGMRLLIPESLDKVTPYVKTGWRIHTTKVSETVTQIEWTGGSIPAEQKDVFLFTARTPGEATTLVWKAYQTYADGTVVAWDEKPGEGGTKVAYPYSVTDVSDDGALSSGGHSMDTSRTPSSFTFSLVALALSVVALSLSLKKKI